MVPYDTSSPTQMYVEPNPKGTQSTTAQKYNTDLQSHWRPDYHTSQSWTTAKVGYNQIES